MHSKIESLKNNIEAGLLSGSCLCHSLVFVASQTCSSSVLTAMLGM